MVIFYSGKWLSGYYVPRSAFASREEARRYYRAALGLWKSHGTVWPQESLDADEEADPLGEEHGPLTIVAPDDNPFAAPRAPLHDFRRGDGPSLYASFLRRGACVLLLEYLVLIPAVLYG